MRRRTTALAGLCISLWMGGCSSSQSGGSASGPPGKQIGPEGGSVLLADGSRVDVPAGALATGVSVTIGLTPSAAALPSSDGIAAGSSYLLGPEGQTFLKPVTVTLAFEPSRLPADVPGDGISVVTSPATGTPDYSPLPTTIVDSTHVSAQTTHFSIVVPVWQRTRPCGNGRIPASAICCDRGSVTSSSYCTSRAGTNTSGTNAPAECFDNLAGMCTGSNPFSSPRSFVPAPLAAYCCSIGGSQGSNDCPAGQYHCGLQCTSDRGGCKIGGSPAGGSGSGGSVNLGGATGAGGTTGTGVGGGSGGSGSGGSGVCCACNFDVTCTTFGAGGCWHCNDSIYVSGVCQAPSSYLVSPGACTCDPSLYQVCP